MVRCQGYTIKGTRCHSRINKELNDKGVIYCCDDHKPKNYDSLIEECHICCMPVDNMDIRILKCGHAHHRKCIERWIEESHNPSCPLCRRKIIKVYKGMKI